ncbi:MAG: hypothetical protein JSW12_16105 [Deltaproteobacteria bacterium]|nr:MAG: hypothetical protein JSW12_16105 [Deltaproteobacteria bacterium]
MDTATGILEKNLPEIFEPLLSTEPTSGPGLGPAIVKRLVLLYGRQMEVESKVNEGTTFTISLPVFKNPVIQSDN